MEHANATPAVGPDRPRLLSLEAAARELGIGRSLACELIAAGTLASVKIGRRRLVPADAIDQFIVSLREQS